MATCASGQYRCRQPELTPEKGNLTVCIPSEWRCDGDTHCPLDDDEVHSSPPALLCRWKAGGWWKDGCVESECRNGAVWCAADERCLASWRRCDGQPHCRFASSRPCLASEEVDYQ